MKRLILILSLLTTLPAAASAAGTGCLDTTGPLTLEKVRSNATGTQIWGCINRSFDRLSSSAAITGSTNTTIFTGGIYTPLIGGISNGAWTGVKMSSYVFFASSASFEGGSVAFRYGITAATGTFSSTLSAARLSLTYGISATTASFSGLASAGGYSATYGISAATGVFTGLVSARDLSATYGVSAATAVFTNRVNAADYTATYGVSAGSAALTYGLTAGTGTFSSGLTASSGTFLVTGAAQHSVKTSSGINVGTGQVLIGSGGYIQYPDGTTQATAPGAGSGDMIKANANAVTGSIDMQSGSSLTIHPNANSYAETWIASQTAASFGRIQFSTAWPGMFWTTATYRFEYYGVGGSSSSLMFFNMNCPEGGDNTAGVNKFIALSINQGNTLQGDSSGAAAYALPALSQQQNSSLLGANAGFHGVAEFEAVNSTNAVRQLPVGGAYNDDCSATSTPCAVTWAGGRWQKAGATWNSMCFDWTASYYNAAITRNRTPAWFTVQVYRRAKRGN